MQLEESQISRTSNISIFQLVRSGRDLQMYRNNLVSENE